MTTAITTDTPALRVKIMGMIDSIFEYCDENDTDKVYKKMHEVLKCLHDNGFLTQELDEDDLYEIEADSKYIFHVGLTDGVDGWNFNDERALSSHYSSFALYVVRNMVKWNNYAASITDSKYWVHVSKIYTNTVMKL